MSQKNDDTGHRRGFLIDLDYAKFLDDDEEPTQAGPGKPMTAPWRPIR